MPKQESKGVVLEGKKDKNITVTEEEMTSLGEFLSQVQQYILNHEARLEAIEEFVRETIMGSYDDAKADETAQVADEPANDTP